VSVSRKCLILFDSKHGIVSEYSFREGQQADDGKLVTEVFMSRGISMSLIKVDTDEVLFKLLLGVILLAALWPLGFLGYLVTVYGGRILVG
jgi:hypothetical protein